MRLLPLMAKEMRQSLGARARAHVAHKCAEALWQRVSVAPYDVPLKQSSYEQGEDEGAPRLRVLSCCWGPGNPSTTFAMLDANGDVVEFLHTGFLTARSTEPMLLAKKREDEKHLQELMKTHKPHLVVLGAANLQCRHLKDEIFEAISTIVEHFPKHVAPEVDNILVVYEDEAFAMLYEGSKAASQDLQGYSGIVKRTVGLGRYAQNRLALVANLFGPSREVLSMKLHPAQDLADEEEVYHSLEKAMVTVTSQVGVDVNLAIGQPWLFAPLKFVCGLGPRKAQWLQERMIAETMVRRRKDLVDPPYLLRPTVFINAATGIRLRGQDDILDDTRIHPADYRLALRVAMDGYCEYKKKSREEVERQRLDVMTEVRYKPNIIANLDFEDYAEALRDSGEADLYDKLILIRRELMRGYAECRLPFRQLDQDEEFALLSGESDETLAEGRLVTARVRRVMPMRALCALESGLLGVIEKSDFSDEMDVNLQETVRVDDVLTCRVKVVQKSKYLVELTCKGSDLRSDRWREYQKRDEFYDLAAARKHEEELKRQSKKKDGVRDGGEGKEGEAGGDGEGDKDDAAKKAVVAAAKRPSFRPRMISYPLFENLSMADAMAKLSMKDIGDVIIRPSSRGPTNLAITMKFYDNICAHIDIAEGGKDRRDITSFLRLGKTLKIRDETFEDLDEVMARYVEPVAQLIRDMVNYRKFRGGSKAEIDSILLQEKKMQPNRIPYYVSPSYEHPGAFMLSYIRTSQPKHEYFTVSPRGYRFRSNDFPTPDRLVRYFQAHINDDITGGGGGGGTGGSGAAGALGPPLTPRRSSAVAAAMAAGAAAGRAAAAVHAAAKFGSIPGAWQGAVGAVSGAAWTMLPPPPPMPGIGAIMAAGGPPGDGSGGGNGGGGSAGGWGGSWGAGGGASGGEAAADGAAASAADWDSAWSRGGGGGSGGSGSAGGASGGWGAPPTAAAAGGGSGATWGS